MQLFNQFEKNMKTDRLNKMSNIAVLNIDSYKWTVLNVNLFNKNILIYSI